MEKNYLKKHRRRYDITISHLQECGYLEDNTKVLELGAPSEFTEILKERCNVNITNTYTDLRYPFYDKEWHKFDLILCMELIEHIKDQDTSNFDKLTVFTGSGIKCMLKECDRLLKDNGVLFVSTPNIHCYRVFENWCNNDEIYTYGPHPRELTMQYLEEVLGKDFHLKVKHIECWGCHGTSPEFIKSAKKFLNKINRPIKNRDKGDIFITCTKK
jgi:2-polyprenyl-3-methyl-5-hydroxy-6-metoxy-1,4-benzoquinol methylase